MCNERFQALLSFIYIESKVFIQEDLVPFLESSRTFRNRSSGNPLQKNLTFLTGNSHPVGNLAASNGLDMGRERLCKKKLLVRLDNKCLRIFLGQRCSPAIRRRLHRWAPVVSQTNHMMLHARNSTVFCLNINRGRSRRGWLHGF